jgi:hypothetical protein
MLRIFHSPRILKEHCSEARSRLIPPAPHDSAGGTLCCIPGRPFSCDAQAVLLFQSPHQMFSPLCYCVSRFCGDSSGEPSYFEAPAIAPEAPCGASGGADSGYGRSAMTLFTKGHCPWKQGREDYVIYSSSEAHFSTEHGDEEDEADLRFCEILFELIYMRPTQLEPGASRVWQI